MLSTLSAPLPLNFEGWGVLRFAQYQCFRTAIPEDYPLLQAKNTLLTPHVTSLTRESMVRRDFKTDG